VLFAVSACTVDRAVAEVRPLLAARGFAVPDWDQGVQAQVDSGYIGLARDFPSQASAPPKKPGKNAGPVNPTTCPK
jgi:hypothetical protein